MNNSYRTDTIIETEKGEKVRLDDILKGAESYMGYILSKREITSRDSEDLMQDITLKILQVAGRYDSAKASPFTYGHMVARSLHLTALRKKLRTAEPFTDFEIKNKDGEYSIPFLKNIRDQKDPESVLIQNEGVSFITDSVASLGEKERMILVRAADGNKVKDIASELGLTANAVSIRLYKTRNALKDQFEGIMHEYRISA